MLFFGKDMNVVLVVRRYLLWGTSKTAPSPRGDQVHFQE